MTAHRPQGLRESFIHKDAPESLTPPLGPALLLSLIDSDRFLENRLPIRS